MNLPRWRQQVRRYAPSAFLAEPFELFLALLCVLSALTQLTGVSEPGVISRLLPEWLVKVWNLELLIGGSLTLVGVLSRRSRLTVLGLQPLGWAALVYAAAVAFAAGTRGLFASAITVAFALACFARTFSINTAAIELAARQQDGEV